jgi:hypothetical protein
MSIILAKNLKILCFVYCNVHSNVCIWLIYQMQSSDENINGFIKFSIYKSQK